MSDTATRRRIRAQASPRDPAAMRFILDAPVQPGRSAGFDEPDSDAPLARALFAVEGVRQVHVAGSTITVTRDDTCDWGALKAPVAAAIRHTLDSADQPLGGAAAREGEARDDDALLAAVREILDRQANPAIASHGGHVAVEQVSDGIVRLRMSGGCQGCAASAATLREGIETMLRAALPEIRDIVDVTDHEAGTAPYYSETPGQTPVMNRPVPAEALAQEDGQVMIDPAYLAPRLGLDPETLRAGLRSGAVVSRSEAGTGDDAGKTRVVIRTPQRAWAAEILPDGTAREIPPPRALVRAAQADNALRDRVRSHLESLPPGEVPVSYGKLARALGHYMPGSVSRIVHALEATMREDAAAGRPFIAALAVSRGRKGQPGRGFFDLARELGRGPAPGEDEAGYHTRELDAVLEARKAGAA